MARDQDRLVLDQLALRRQAAEKRKAEFLEALPEGYPTPRADQEWQAYRGLLRHWTRRQI
jgi:hypothetical protein